MTNANNLTDEQRKALLDIGAPTGKTAMVSKDVLKELIRMGLLYERIDITEKGERLYQELRGG